MNAFTRVVVGLDGSQSAENALRWAADRVTDACALHVVHAGAPDPTVPVDIGVQSVHSRDAAPAEALMATAAEIDADAIVIGPHGSGLGFGLGSVAKELLNRAEVPVIIVEGREPPRSIGLTPPVVACVGYGAPASAAATWAADFAEERGLPLVLLHAVAYRPIFPIDSASDVLASYLGTGVSAKWASDELSEIATELMSTRPHLSVSSHIDYGSVPKAIRQAGETAEIVVLGKRSGEEFLHTIGTPRLRRLIARSRFPTAVVPASFADD